MDIAKTLRESCFCEGRGCELCRAADEIDRLRAELAECRAFMNRYAVHQITCNRNPCTCGFDSSWPETRRGEGE